MNPCIEVDTVIEDRNQFKSGVAIIVGWDSQLPPLSHATLSVPFLGTCGLMLEGGKGQGVIAYVVTCGEVAEFPNIKCKP